MPTLKRSQGATGGGRNDSLWVGFMFVCIVLAFWWFIEITDADQKQAKQINIAIFIFDKSENIDEKLNKVMMAEWKKSIRNFLI